MSATTTQAELSTQVMDKPLNLPDAISELLNLHSEWRGTAQELANALRLDIAPRSLSVKLDKLEDELKRRGVAVSHKKIKGRKVLVLSLAGNHTAIATKPHTPTSIIGEEGVANSHAYEGVIRFPFSWSYGTITELSDEEKEKVNRTRHIGRKYYYKICAICGGNGGYLDFRKVSDGSSCLICRECAIRYVRKARELQSYALIHPASGGIHHK